MRVTCGGPLPVHEADSIRAVTLPKHARTVGSYAFYNCRSLEELTMTDSVSAFDGGSLMNCLSLHRIRLLAPPGGATCLPKILGETASELDVRFLHGDTCTPLLFPAYTEELEDLSPAHIFQRRIHGAGYSYRQCFDGAVLNLRQYDRALSELAERHDFAIAARVAVRRLAAPFALSDSARADYLAVLREHGGPLACALAKQGDSVSLHVLLSLSVLPDAGIDAACTAAREGRADRCALRAAHRRRPVKAARTRKNIRSVRRLGHAVRTMGQYRARNLFSARSELYMNLPFLDGALAALPVQDGFETSSLATDAKALYFSGAWLAQRFERSRTSVNRAYLHTVFHCLLRHPAKMRGRDRDLWSLACDIAVESLLDSLDYRCLAPDKTSVRRRSLYRSLHEHMPVLTAEAVYRHFRRERMNSYDCATLTRVFAVDEHTLWPEDDDDQDRRWQQQAQRTQTAMDTVFASEATGGEAVREQLAVSARRTTDYRAFLRRFSALREETAIDADSFDYGYYAYGLRRYGNMPLIEPLETRETRKIEDFVIAIDTSMSTSGELVRAFLERTCELLQQNTSFFRRINLRILQCDDKLRSDKVIHDAKEFADYMEHFELIGQSATDFRPVFEHVDRLAAEAAFHSLRGLIYFTDGLGLYPKKRPKYDAAFVMLDGECWPDSVPPWGIRVILREDEILTELSQN